MRAAADDAKQAADRGAAPWRRALRRLALVVCVPLLPAALLDDARAALESRVSATKHNLSISGTGTVKATTESQICVFCHTPHGAENQPGTPLWNRKFSSATYVTYTSSSIEADAAELAAGPGGTSKLCLSCHDGTMSIANVDVLNARGNVTVTMTGLGAGNVMPAGNGVQTGFTRNLGVNLKNDHPISFTYNATLATNDGELRTPDGTNVGTRQPRTPGAKPKLPLDGGRVQCTTCHDPHIRETDATQAPIKFLRLNRFQKDQPLGGAFSQANDIICIACHDKAGTTWAYSAHANKSIATAAYKETAADQREFKRGTQVWEAACLNCHDAHTVEGARRLLREGTDSTASPKSGGKSAIEETCYQCHRDTTGSVLNNATSVPNIRDEFVSSTYKMPITNSGQGGSGVTDERHDIGTGSGTRRGKDFVESAALLGKGDLTNRHVECTDCHNPHRVTKKRAFNASGQTADAGGSHDHAAGHTNIASGVLRGTTGVEPVYGGVAFGSLPSSYDLKRGDGGDGASTLASSAWVTREYQVCLKCHSDYAYDSAPTLGYPGGTASGTNNVTSYTNQAMEFQAPSTHRGQVTTTDSGAYAGQVRPCGGAACGTGNCACYNVNFQTNNHRSWHPVIDSTGRTYTIRNMNTSGVAWRAPWNANANVGSQTMYCTDCHGANTASDTVVPSGRPWGPHGSSNPFLLKGEWSGGTGATGRENSYSTNALCFKCHNPANYATRNTTSSSGFGNSSSSNLHGFHTDKLERLHCTWCHMAVPHGWKNKAFLVNLNDVGPEAGLAPGTQVRNKTTAAYNNGPYYVNAVLKIRTFATSGNWSASNCGSSGEPGNGQSGRDWMRDSNENCTGAP